jgi:hypothetical protein
LSHISSPFSFGYFGDGDLRNYLLGWPRTAILLIFASQVAKERAPGTQLKIAFNNQKEVDKLYSDKLRLTKTSISLNSKPQILRNMIFIHLNSDFTMGNSLFPY